MQVSIEQLLPDDPEWQQFCDMLKAKVTLSAQVLVAWRMGIWLARTILEQQLQERAAISIEWKACPVCQTRLVSKGFAKRRILTLVGWVEWQRRVGRCPHRCRGSQSTPFDQILGINAYQQTSTELMRFGSLLAVFLPFELAAWLLQQVSGIQVSEDTIWNWVQVVGEQAMTRLETELQQFSQQQLPQPELLESTVAQMPLVIAADCVTAPFRSQPQTPRGKTVWREVKVARFARLSKGETRTEQNVTRLHEQRLVAVLGDIDDLKPRLQLEAFRQGITTAPHVAWISDGSRGLWRLYQECFADRAVGILDFYHAVQHLWKAASTYQDGNPNRTPQQWFAHLRHRLRHGYTKPLIRELHRLSHYRSTSDTTRPLLRQVRDYLQAHLEHIQYSHFRKLGLPIGSGMVESACKWLIQQRFKGAGMRWSEDGFNHLLHLRLAWANQRFDPLFSDEQLTLSLYSPNR
jgi:hypothetical protein